MRLSLVGKIDMNKFKYASDDKVGGTIGEGLCLKYIKLWINSIYSLNKNNILDCNYVN